ncbi:MAG TPA: GNAT family N-acetyltransferase [Actinomycetes bacterium]|nr:GNAT family N-acetyltransferase [Actinomycetes bacterium]
MTALIDDVAIATQLMKHALAVARSDGCTHAVLPPTAATIPFYERLGFRLERLRPDHWYYLPESR